MNDSAYRVDTTSRLAQWRIENLASCTYRKSDPFRIGKWNWYLSIEKSRMLSVRFFPEVSNFTRENPPVASFRIRLISSVGDRKCLVHPDVIDKPLKSNEDFVWTIEIPLTGKFIIDVEFLDLKTTSADVRSILPMFELFANLFLCSNLIFKTCKIELINSLVMGTARLIDLSTKQGSAACSIWGDAFTQAQANETALACFGRMLSESIHTDITINIADGRSIAAHRAVLASRSPVFRSMFSHNLKEKELSAIFIADMSMESCRAFLNYVYGNIQTEEFLAHRLALLRAADKYDVSDLKVACHESLIEDIDSRNVLERLHNAALYQLPELKSGCIRYLVKFGKIFDIGDEINAFILSADRELIGELFGEVLASWKGF